jgi:tetratricopeptide (TPR) repeat protein
MKPSRPSDPRRWRDRDPDAHALESRAAVLADAVGPPPPLGPGALARIRSQVLARRSDRGVFDLRRLPGRARWAFGIGVILACVTTAGGASALWRHYRGSAERTASTPAAQAARPVAHRASRVSSRAKETEAPGSETAAPGTPETSPPPAAARADSQAAADVSIGRSPRGRDASRRLSVLPEVAPTIPAPAVSEPIPPPAVGPAQTAPASATEAGLVAEALSDLRQLNDPRAALATLDRYGQAFPHGVLETEALRTRAEAVIRLGDLRTALALLESASALPDALGADLLLTRAELRASAGRFREALMDFDRVLDRAAGPLGEGGDERALYGRAVCLGHLSQDERARVDLLVYQQRFPKGRFASEVQRLLAGPAPSPRP